MLDNTGVYAGVNDNILIDVIGYVFIICHLNALWCPFSLF